MEEQHDELQHLSSFACSYYTQFFKGMCHSCPGAVCLTKIKDLSHGESLFWWFIYCLTSFFSQYHNEMVYFYDSVISKISALGAGKGGRKKKVQT